MSSGWPAFAFILLVAASIRCFPQATAPMNTSIMPQLQQNYPGGDIAPGPAAVGKYLGYAVPGLTCSGPNENSVRLDATKQILALLLAPPELQKLLNFEDVQFGAGDSAEKLEHRTTFLTALITGLKGH